MTSIVGSMGVPVGVDADRDEASRIGEFLASHGGPFYELQRRVGVLEEDALHAGRRAAIFVALAWGVPLLLSLVAGRAFGPADAHPYLLDFGAWARFFIADGPLSSGRAAGRIRAAAASSASLSARRSWRRNPSKTAASAVVRALKLRNSGVAEIICLGLAVAGTLALIDHSLTSTPRPGRSRSARTARM